jgi:hypothetical protein
VFKSTIVGAAALLLILAVFASFVAWLFAEDRQEQRTTALSLLSLHGESYGLDLVHRSHGVLKRGSVYIVLDALEDEGAVVSRIAPAGDVGGSRRLYRLADYSARPTHHGGRR